jgi:GntR family transcriptional regulator
MALNPRSPIPLYQQFKMAIERKIATGEWQPDKLIPTEAELTAEYGISRTTVRQAFADLVTEGRIYRQRGRGSYVAPPKLAQTLGPLTGFAEELTLRGLEPVIVILDHGMVRADRRVAQALQIDADRQVLCVRRLVSAAGLPLFADESYFPEALRPILGREQIEGQPIYRLLESGGYYPAHGEQRLGAVAIDPRTAGHLGVAPGTPGLAITRVTSDQLGLPIEYANVIYRGDRYEYAIQLQRG